MLVLLGVLVVLVIVGAAVFDLIALRRGRYRPPSHWKAAAGRRKRHFRDVRERRSADAQLRRPY